MAKLCSDLVNSKIASLNAEILFWWLVQQYPEIYEFINRIGIFDDSGEDTHLFDVCLSNTYIEAEPVCNQYLSNVLELLS